MLIFENGKGMQIRTFSHEESVHVFDGINFIVIFISSFWKIFLLTYQMLE